MGDDLSAEQIVALCSSTTASDMAAGIRALERRLKRRQDVLEPGAAVASPPELAAFLAEQRDGR